MTASGTHDNDALILIESVMKGFNGLTKPEEYVDIECNFITLIHLLQMHQKSTKRRRVVMTMQRFISRKWWVTATLLKDSINYRKIV
jgi:hypothetical protein